MPESGSCFSFHIFTNVSHRSKHQIQLNSSSQMFPNLTINCISPQEKIMISDIKYTDNSSSDESEIEINAIKDSLHVSWK